MASVIEVIKSNVRKIISIGYKKRLHTNTAFKIYRMIYLSLNRCASLREYFTQYPEIYQYMKSLLKNAKDTVKDLPVDATVKKEVMITLMECHLERLTEGRFLGRNLIEDSVDGDTRFYREDSMSIMAPSVKWFLNNTDLNADLDGVIIAAGYFAMFHL